MFSQKKFVYYLLLLLMASIAGFSQLPTTLTIEGNQIWVRSVPKTGKVVMKLDEGTQCKVLEKGMEQVIRGHKDFWYKIEYKGQQGWVYGSQSSIKQSASLDNFEIFMGYFLQTCYSNQNIDYLIYSKNTKATRFIHSKIGYTWMYNPGAACVALDYDYLFRTMDNPASRKSPNLAGLPYFKNQKPVNGFCEESTSPEGIYYEVVDALPSYPDMSGDYQVKTIPVPDQYMDETIVKVWILNKKWITKTMYFITADGEWWLVVINDCDCSA